MNGFPERLKVLMQEGSLAEFAERCGVSASLLHKYLKGSVPGLDKLVLIAQASQCSLDWLATGEGLPPGSPQQGSGQDYVFIPLYEVSASAGSGTLVEEDIQVGSVAFHEGWIRQMLRANPKHLEMIYVRGESMEPTLCSGDMVLLNRRMTEVTEGIYVLRLDGGLFVKRLHLLPGKQIRVISDNPSYESFVIQAQAPPDDFAVLGRVIWSSHVH
ncbi:MAG: helix-turn-helix transcriptional regulator [Cyanobacteriota bacterium]|nr:helix-turn-helix transcriptional regulator [Cyanobacteriota bacterium]